MDSMFARSGRPIAFRISIRFTSLEVGRVSSAKDWRPAHLIIRYAVRRICQIRLEGAPLVGVSSISCVGGFLEFFFSEPRAKEEAAKMEDQSVEKRTNEADKYSTIQAFACINKSPIVTVSLCCLN